MIRSKAMMLVVPLGFLLLGLLPAKANAFWDCYPPVTVYRPAPVVTYYHAAPTVTYYRAPSVTTYYHPPTVTTYYPRPAVRYYRSATVYYGW